MNPLRRRSFLKLGLGGAIVLAVGGAALKYLVLGYGAMLDAGDKPTALSTKEFAIVKALVKALVPADGPLPSGDALGVAQRVDEELWSATPELCAEMKAGLQLFEHGTTLHGMGTRFTALDPAMQRTYMALLLDGGNDTLRQVASGLRQVIHLFYWGNPATWKAIDYDGPLVAKAVPPDSHVAYSKLIGKEPAS
jgi:hypothetical protein